MVLDIFCYKYYKKKKKPLAEARENYRKSFDRIICESCYGRLPKLLCAASHKAKNVYKIHDEKIYVCVIFTNYHVQEHRLSKMKIKFLE